MPELPEVECIVRSLRPKLIGSVISAATVLSPIGIREPAPDTFAAQIAGRRVSALSRRAKYIVLQLDDGWHLLIHLGMTGQLLLTQSTSAEPRFTRLALHLDADRTLWFADMRKFGRLALTQDPKHILQRLGPEPLDPDLNVNEFHSRLRKRRRPIKSLLLDQSFLAGIGNIYADEALFEACLDPTRKASSLTRAEAAHLLASTRSVLTRGIANHGTTIATYVDSDGAAGTNQDQLRVYGRAGHPCPRCQNAIVRIRLSGCSACFCPHCQALPPERAAG